MTAPQNSRFVWFQYLTADVKKAQAFLGELFNWTVVDVPMGDGDPYQMIAVGDRTIGGYAPIPSGASSWQSMLGVASAKATAAQIAKLGGKIVEDATPAGDAGTYAVVTDPHGGAFALWQTAKPEPEQPVIDSSFVWNELMSVDAEASVKFYRAIGGFDHKAQDMGPIGTYHLLMTGEVPRAGIMNRMSPQQPHAWTPYVQVASADATTEKAKRLGATIAVPPDDIPGVGRFSILIDPLGATIGLMQPPKA